MIENLEELLKKTDKVLPNEDLFLEVVRDIIKDEIKSYLKEKMKNNPKIREEIRDAILKYVDSKVKEAEANTLLLKSLGELGVLTLPPEVKDDLIAHFYKTFQKEIDEFLDKTL